MTDFKKFMDDCSHLFSGISSLTHNLKSEAEQNLHLTFQSLIKEAGFVHKDEFEIFSQRFEEAVKLIKALELKIDTLTTQLKDIQLKDNQDEY